MIFQIFATKMFNELLFFIPLRHKNDRIFANTPSK